MYIIEKLVKIYLKLKNKDNTPILPDGLDKSELEDVVTCQHNFLPIDSTSEILACSKCGYLVRKKRLKKKNQ